MSGKKNSREPAARIQMMPRDTDGLGKISGGVILSNIDLAAAVTARKICTSRSIRKIVTRAMDKVEFKRPVYVNDILTCYGKISQIGNTSITVQVDVEAERNGKRLLVTRAEAVFVALDSEGKPTPISDNPADPAGPKRKRRRISLSPALISPTGEERLLAVRKVMMPNEINSQGDIFGGILLTYMDMAGSYAAMRSCKNQFIERCVTRQMSSIEFKKPVYVGDILSCYAQVTRMGNTSICVHVDVEAKRGQEIIPVTAADLVFVAVDENGQAISTACLSKKSRRCSKRSCSRRK